MRVTKLAVFLFCMVLLSGNASAFGMRCGNSLITLGALDYEVLRRCGAPTAIQDIGGIQNRWIYDRGPTHFIAVVHFQNGKLSSIKYYQK